MLVEARCSTYFSAVAPCRMWDLIDERLTTLEGTPRGSALERQVDSILAGRASVPEDVAKLVSFLSGPDSDHMTGVLIRRRNQFRLAGVRNPNSGEASLRARFPGKGVI
ncbi:hypothetical protein [Arthrobacter sunyaminii]|uniref:Uncharacterized protein n=1 Tax=Arthrobacter sunyaminii TaxID=2816859 RepID=A0A975XLD7_9MICC|nr:hypothetical protein [Arthrobacter sunyaminii]MBO0907755.1 hypothetical protein [Arthrobacter sunyaminii]QWQ36818.1 hypothetical protein KG104_03185 [Arthrobacter sunyaminii]